MSLDYQPTQLNIYLRPYMPFEEYHNPAELAHVRKSREMIIDHAYEVRLLI